jgi:molybdenum cofactor cytidylyltransferase
MRCSRISAVILAAGTSSRMGTAKQLLRWDDRPLLQHVLDSVRASAAADIVLVLGFEAEAIQREIEPQNVRIAINHNFQQGMGTSLKAGLAAIDSEAEGALIILADQPLVRPATLDRLIAEHRVGKAQIVIPTYRGFRGNPVLLDRSIFPEVMNLGGDIGCRAIFGDHIEGIVKVPVDDVGILLDIDQRSDLDALRASALKGKTLLETAQRGDGQVADSLAAQPELIVVGRDALARGLARLGQILRFIVTVVDPLLATADFPEADRVLHTLDFSLLGTSPDRHVVVASRGACDEEAIEQALDAKSAYVALVANRKRGEEVLHALRGKGIPPQELASVRIPAGLEICADTPEEIALAIMAQIVLERRKRGTTQAGRTHPVRSSAQ